MDWVVSDIHGCYLTLQELLDRVRKADEDARLIFVGDYVDRGLKNREVIDLMIELQKQGAICLRGNHDNIVDWILNEECMGDLRDYVAGFLSYDSVVSWWMRNGLAPTLKSYGIKPDPQDYGPYGGQYWGGTVMAFRESVPDDHKNFFRSLQLFWESDTHFACHAFYPPESELPIPNVLTGDVIHNSLWNRFRRGILSDKFDPPAEIKWDKVGVFGHTPVQYYGGVAPIKYDKIRLIDCGVFLEGYICAYCCGTDDWILQATVSDDIESS